VTELDYFIDLVTKEMDRRQWTSYKLAKEAELPVSTISTFLTKRTEIKYNTIIKICNALEINAGVLTNHDIPNVDYTILSNEHMTLIEITRTLGEENVKILNDMAKKLVLTQEYETLVKRKANSKKSKENKN